MKLRIAVLLVACAMLVATAWILLRPVPSVPQPIHFAGYTNGVVGAVVPVFARLRTNNAATIQHWMAAGTNGVEFTITNQQSCAIWLFPLGRICTAASPIGDETPLLNAPTFSGIRVPPGQTATVQVAVLSHQEPWRLQLLYHRDSCSDTLLNRLRLLPQEVRCMTTGRPLQMRMYTMESDWFDR